MRNLLYSISGLLFVFFPAIMAQPGTIDSDFDADGKTVLDISGDHDYAYAVAVQEDGKIVVVGQNSGEI